MEFYESTGASLEKTPYERRAKDQGRGLKPVGFYERRQSVNLALAAVKFKFSPAPAAR